MMDGRTATHEQWCGILLLAKKNRSKLLNSMRQLWRSLVGATLAISSLIHQSTLKNLLEKPALKVVQGLLAILEENDSTQSLQVLGGDSTNMNTGWRGGTHAHLEELLGRRLYWAICNLHCNELPLRHLITLLDGPTSSKEGFTGPVCSLLSKVGEMPYNPKFKALPGGEDLIELSEEVVNNMSTDQSVCYKLVVAVKKGELPPSLLNMKCGSLNHARYSGTLTLSLFDQYFGSL